MIEDGAVPWTILRATQFHDFVADVLDRLSRGPVALALDGTDDQPVDVREVAARLVELVEAGPSGRVTDLGGPEVLSTSALHADLPRGDRPAPSGVGGAVPASLNGFRRAATSTPAHADGRLTFAEWIRVPDPVVDGVKLLSCQFHLVGSEKSTSTEAGVPSGPTAMHWTVVPTAVGTLHRDVDPELRGDARGDLRLDRLAVVGQRLDEVGPDGQHGQEAAEHQADDRQAQRPPGLHPALGCPPRGLEGAGALQADGGQDDARDAGDRHAQHRQDRHHQPDVRRRVLARPRPRRVGEVVLDTGWIQPVPALGPWS